MRDDPYFLASHNAGTCASAENEHAVGVESTIGQRHEKAPRTLERARLRSRFVHHIGGLMPSVNTPSLSPSAPRALGDVQATERTPDRIEHVADDVPVSTIVFSE